MVVPTVALPLPAPALEALARPPCAWRAFFDGLTASFALHAAGTASLRLDFGRKPHASPGSSRSMPITNTLARVNAASSTAQHVVIFLPIIMSLFLDHSGPTKRSSGVP